MTDRRGEALRTALAIALPFVVFALWARPRIDGDGLGYLARRKAAVIKDAPHPLYPLALEGAVRTGRALGIGEDRSALLLSAAGAAALFALMRALALRLGAREPTALAAAIAVTTAPLFVDNATTVEVHANAVACLTASLLCAVLYSQKPRVLSRIAVFAFAFAAAGFHVAALLALPAIVVAADGLRGLRRHGRVDLALFLAVAAIAFALGVRPMHARDLYDATALAFELRNGHDAHPIRSHFRTARDILIETMPVATILGVTGALFAVVRRRRILGIVFLWVLPFVATFIGLGVPIAGLWLPILPAIGVCIAGIGGPRGDETPSKFARLTAMLALAVAIVPVAYDFPARLREAARPDDLGAFAREIELKSPPNLVLIADRMAPALRRYTGMEIKNLATIYSAVRGAPDPASALLEALRDLAARNAKRGRLTAIDSDAGRLLVVLANRPIAPDEIIDPNVVLVIRDEPRYALYLMKSR